MSDQDDWGYRYFPRSVPREAKGGIKAKSKRGAFAESWWAKRWIAVLEGFNIGARLQRGRSYARRGQVVSIEIAKGVVRAKVQGSRPKPYSVEIDVKPLPLAKWNKVAETLNAQAIFAAKLLNGEMPREIETVFQAAGATLFPERLTDLTTDCSCPDWSNPCKHIAAVYYLLGEEFDRDPFLIFRLRGMEREELLGQLAPVAEAERPPEPEPLGIEGFWTAGALPDDFPGEIEIPREPAIMLRRLGAFPFWRGKRPLAEQLEPVYTRAAERALDLAASLNPGPVRQRPV